LVFLVSTARECLNEGTDRESGNDRFWCCVVPVPGDYEKIRGADIEKIFEEVTVPEALFRSVEEAQEIRQ
jgi:hypothetical protein